MKVFEDIKMLIHPYHSINLVMSLSFLAARYVPGLCELLFAPAQCGELSMVRMPTTWGVLWRGSDEIDGGWHRFGVIMRVMWVKLKWY